MYLLIVVMLLGVLPIASIGIEYAQSAGNLMELVGKWFVFWAVGVRLVIAGARQVLQPAHAALSFFSIEDPKARPIVQELGFGNLALGMLGLVSLWQIGWIAPAALAGALYYGLAGIRHLGDKVRTDDGVVAMIADLIVCVILAAYLVDLAAA